VGVLLVQPNYQKARESRGGTWGIHPPLGLCYLASVLEHHNVSVKILDANALNLNETEVIKYIRETNPSLIGFTMLTPSHSFCLNVVKEVREDYMIVAGGPHASALPQQLAQEGFIVVRGEGENTILDLVTQKPLKDIEGITYMGEDGLIHHNPNRLPISDLDSIPFPARYLLPNNGVDQPYRSAASRYATWATVLTSRGCPYSCYYCNKNIFSHRFRSRSPENVVNEIEILVKKYSVKEIDIADDAFNFDLKRAETILDMIVEKKLDIYLRATNGLRVDKITPSFLTKFKKAGGDYIAYGVESGSQEVLDRIPKGITLDQIKHTVELTKKAKIRVAGFFMFGLLGDTPVTMQQTIDFAKELDLDIAVFNILAPYPGTRLWEIIQEKGGKMLLENYDDFHHTANRALFTLPGVPEPEEVVAAYRRAHKEFYFRPKYIFKQLWKTRSLTQLKEMMGGLKSLLQIS
jgi:radical SAM superfamily enzyme YgiQ (UPF0313 family)